MTAATDVLVIVHEARRTGPPIYALELVTWLRANTSLDLGVVLLAGGPLAEEFAAVCPTTPFPSEADLADLVAATRVVYVNTAVSIEALDGVPTESRTVLTHVHEMEIGLSYWLAPAARRILFERTDRFLVGPDAARDNLTRNHAVPPSRIGQVPYFVPSHPPVTAAAVAEVRGRLGVGADGVIVGACGAREWRKAPDLFAHVAWELDQREVGQPVTFVWVGSPIPTGPHWDEAAELDLLDLGDRIQYVEDQADIEPWLAAFDIFALTSREDTFPLACLSAAAQAVPPVCFDNGGIPEMVAASGGGRVVAYPDVAAMADEVETLVRDRMERERSGQAVRAHVEAHHTLAASAAAVAAELEGALT